MTAVDVHDEYVPGRGTIEIWHRDDGAWGVSWHPNHGDHEPAVTYTPDDPAPPEDFPTQYDVDALMEWATSRWGSLPY